MNPSDPYLLSLLIEEDHERRLREADEARVARAIDGIAPRRWLSHLSFSLSLKPRHHARRPRLSA